MDLGQLEATKAAWEDERAKEIAQEEGQDCSIVLQLPDGTQHPHTFKMGATVAYVKLQVEQAYSIPMGKQKLTTSQGKTLIDPLSLADCPGITPDAACLVLVSEIGE